MRLDRDRCDALGELERGLDGVGDAAPDVGLGDEPVDDDLDRVLVRLGQPDRLAELVPAVDARTRGSPSRELVEPAVLALASANDGGEDLEPVPSGSSITWSTIWSGSAARSVRPQL